MEVPDLQTVLGTNFSKFEKEPARTEESMRFDRVETLGVKPEWLDMGKRAANAMVIDNTGGWCCDDHGEGERMRRTLPADVLTCETSKIVIDGKLPCHPAGLFALVNAANGHVERERRTSVWPSKENACRV